MAKKKDATIDVTTEVVKPKRVREKFFKFGNIEIPAQMELDRERFDRIYKGKISTDLNDLWKRYQDWKRKNQ